MDNSYFRKGDVFHGYILTITLPTDQFLICYLLHIFICMYIYGKAYVCIYVYSVIFQLFTNLLRKLRGKCSYREFFWSVFPRIQSKYGKMGTRKIAYLDTFRAVGLIKSILEKLYHLLLFTCSNITSFSEHEKQESYLTSRDEEASKHPPPVPRTTENAGL